MNNKIKYRTTDTDSANWTIEFIPESQKIPYLPPKPSNSAFQIPQQSDKLAQLYHSVQAAAKKCLEEQMNFKEHTANISENIRKLQSIVQKLRETLRKFSSPKEEE